MKFRFVHMAGLVPAHFWKLTKTKQAFERVERKPSHLCAVMHAIVDDLLCWEDGQVVEDHSKQENDPERWFTLRALLLYWCGDYPGQGEASGFGHSAMSSRACHWCDGEAGEYSIALKRQKFGQYYR